MRPSSSSSFLLLLIPWLLFLPSLHSHLTTTSTDTSISISTSTSSPHPRPPSVYSTSTSDPTSTSALTPSTAPLFHLQHTAPSRLYDLRAWPTQWDCNFFPVSAVMCNSECKRMLEASVSFVTLPGIYVDGSWIWYWFGRVSKLCTSNRIIQ